MTLEGFVRYALLSGQVRSGLFKSCQVMSDEVYVRSFVVSLLELFSNNRGQWVDEKDPPLELLQRLYRDIVADELKVRAPGIPEKQGPAHLPT